MGEPIRLQLLLLGEIEVLRGEQPLALPPSKKTRALLAYLAVTGRPHRRERLCAMFWEIPDDPRGALRWSLSKLRALVDEADRPRIVGDRDTIAFDGADVAIDLLAVRAALADGIAALPTERLEQLARTFRGEFLEGLELPDLNDVQAWLVAEREDARGLHAQILAALVERLADWPDRALPHARALVQIEPYDEAARAGLVRLLAAAGRPGEAEHQFQTGDRLLKELGAAPSGALRQAWREASQRTPDTAPPAAPAPAAAEPVEEAPSGPPPAAAEALIGRQAECARLLAALDEAAAARRERILLLKGEPGIGKSRLLAALMDAARRRGGTVLDGRAYEAESSRPYGPWIDALRRLPAAAIGKTIAAELAPLLPELAGGDGAQVTRDRLFAAVVEVIAARAHSAPPVLIVLDDVQWCDEASAALLHYVARMSRHRPLLVALAAREGEMPDNPAMLGVLRGLRRDGMIEEMTLGPLGRRDTEALVAALAPAAEARRVFDESAGNPLLALEVARSLPHRRDAVPQTLSQLVRDRIDRLPPAAAEALRWAAVLGPSISVRWLAEVVDRDLDLAATLETLERHALIRPSSRGGAPDRPSGAERDSLGLCSFAHELVQRAVYADLSEPRRRLMHQRLAQALRRFDDPDGAIAADIVHHAALAGDAEAAARACVAAGRRCLRVFANVEAHAMARRGLHHAEAVHEPDRVQLMLELMQIALAARRPDSLAETTRTLETLAERALDFGCLEHARLGFHLVSVLHWEGGDWSDAHRQSLRAELISRSADEKQQIVAMAEAARCLALLERDLGQAETLAREASALAQRLGKGPVAIPVALGMLRLHQGRLDEAAALFDEARAAARRDGDHLEEYEALAHRVMLEFQRGGHAAAAALSADLVRLGEKLREGSEAPFAHALAALARYAQDGEDGARALEAALKDLRHADAKHRLARVLMQAAEIELALGAAARALPRAEEALRIGRLLGRPSDTALAQAIAARAAAALGNDRGFREHAAALAGLSANAVSAQARAAMQAVLGQAAPRRRKARTS